MQRNDVTPVTRFVTFLHVAVEAVPLRSEFSLAQVDIKQLFALSGHRAHVHKRWPLVFA